MLVDDTLKKNLIALFDQMEKSPMSNADYAAALASILDTQIKTAEVQPGILVSTSSGAGSTSGPGKLL